MTTALEGRIDVLLTRSGTVAIHSSRPQLAQRLLAGRAPAEAAELAGIMFSLCGRAQRLAARLACAAAEGQAAAAEAGQEAFDLLAELAQEHAWRLLLDWPVEAGHEPDRAGLVRIRAAAGPEPLAEALDATLAGHLGEPPAAWLARDPAAFDTWCRADSPLAALFAALGDGPDPGACAVPLLPPLADPDHAALDALAARALAEPRFCAQPEWQGGAAETGALARQAGGAVLARWIARRGRGAGARMLARLTELARLPGLLRAGTWDGWAAAWPVAPGAGMAAVETARGLLMHVVRIGAGRVVAYRILAPTEWNFHPKGPLAQGLAALAALDKLPGLETRARLLARSLDPCVEFALELRDA